VSKLGILLTTSPENENTNSVIAITESALSLGHEVSIFVMDDGVYNIKHQKFHSLTKKGAKVTVCAYNAEQRSLDKVEGVLFGSQYDLAIIAHESDRFLSFG